MIARTGKKIFLHIVMPLHYRFLCLLHPVKKKVLFLELRYDGLSDNLELLHEAYEKEGKYDLSLFCLRTAEGGFAGYMGRCLKMARALCDASIVYVDESSDVLAAVPVRKKTVVIQCWHACGAFKRFGHGLEGGLKEEYYGPYSLVTVSSPGIVPCYAQAMNQKESVVKPLGVSRTDVFFDEEYLLEAKKRIDNLAPGIAGKKKILFAPTFRGNVGNAVMSPMPDMELWLKDLDDDTVVLYKGHPALKESPKVPERYKDRFYDVSKRAVISDLLASCDLCITDYSSLVFEYSIFDRPIVFYVPDIEEYDDERGFYHTVRELDAGQICTDTVQLSAAVRRELYEADENAARETKERLARFKSRFMESCDGQATKRIMEEAERILHEKNEKEKAV